MDEEHALEIMAAHGEQLALYMLIAVALGFLAAVSMMAVALRFGIRLRGTSAVATGELELREPSRGFDVTEQTSRAELSETSDSSTM